MVKIIILSILLISSSANAREIIPHTGPYIQTAWECTTGGPGSNLCFEELKSAGKGLLGDAIFITINGLIYTHNGEMEDDIKEKLKE